MSLIQRPASLSRPLIAASMLALVWIALPSRAHAQFIQQQVGGVSIDAKGLVSNVRVDELNELKRVRQAALKPVPNEFKALGLRKVSLRGLEAAIAENRKNGTPLSDEMRYLAGLQRVQYIFVYPQLNDLVIAGPGEGWRLSPQGEVVGVTTNRPVLLLDDLLVALRSIEKFKQNSISCSIDPTREGHTRLDALLKSVQAITNPAPVMAAIEEALGPQTITVTGVPEDSHFARVLVAADYRMKRIAMAFDDSPVKALPSFMHMLKASSRPRAMMPRWWLEPNYDALVTDGEGLAWELRGAGVKALTEEEVFTASGERHAAAQANPLAKKWADAMTTHYEELAIRDVVFGQLRNCIDMAVVAALIAKERLNEKTGWDMALLLNPDLLVESYNAPHSVDSRASVLQKGNSWIISASGGVQVNPWQLLENAAASPELGKARSSAAARTTSWWWN